MTTLRRTLMKSVLALLLGGATVMGGAACDSTKVAGTGGTGGTTGLGGSTGLGGTSAGGGAAGTTTGAGGAGGAGIALVDWVTDLADNHTDDVSPPDTVADKNIIDTDLPGAFDPLLAR